MKNYRALFLQWTTILAAGVFFVACGGGGGSDNNVVAGPATFRITVTNLTHNQPFSPPAMIFHLQGYELWEVGEPVSAALENLAESGDPGDVLSQAAQDANVLASGAGTGVIPPGGSQASQFSFEAAGARMTLATMLVNTNDAFAGLSGRSIGELALNDSLIISLAAYDAGTEANTESAGTIPGPAANGQGFNAQRDDRDFVVIHPGVITSQDGLAGSALDGSHRWDNPVLSVTIERIG